MNWTAGQRATLLLPHIAAQRWALIGLAVVAPTTASIFTALAAGRQSGGVVALVLGLATLAAIRPDTQTATAVEAVVVLQWLATTDDTTSAWAVLVALSLFVFHVVIALVALAPNGGTIHRSILLRWARRSILVVLATLGTWAVVYVMAERQAPGSAALTVLGFVTLTGLIVMTLGD